MTAKRRLTNPERLLMGIFWDAEKPLDSSEVIRRAKDAKWSNNHYFKILRTLEDDGFLKVCGLEQKGTRYARLFTPGISKEEYVAMTVEIEGLSSSALMRVALAFLRKSSLEKKEAERRKLIEELEEMIEQYKNEGGEEEK